MANRDDRRRLREDPRADRGAGWTGSDNVSMSGGSGCVLNPNTDNPELAWELLAFMASPEAIKAGIGTTAQITARDDVNDEILAEDPMLTFVSRRRAADHELPARAGRVHRRCRPRCSRRRPTSSPE